MKMRFRISLLLVLAAFLAACAPAAPAPTVAVTVAPITLTDGLGRAVALERPAQKIVSLAPSNTEILFAIGAGSQVVGRDQFSDYPPEAAGLPVVGGDMGKYNLEAVTNLQPDLVLAAEINTPEQVQAIENLGLKVFYLPNPKNVEGIYGTLETVAKLTGREKETAALNESLRERVEAVKAKIAPLSSTFVVFYELDGSDPAKPWTTGPGTYMDEMLSMAGGQNAARGLSSAWGQISQEELLVQNPSVILLGDGAYGVTPEQVTARPGWDQIAAVQSGRIYTFDDDLVSRPGPRMVDGLELIAKLLRPELFK